MKRLLFLFAAAIAFSASAASFNVAGLRPMPVKSTGMTAVKHKAMDKGALQAPKLTTPDLRYVITEQPIGTVVKYNRAGKYTYASDGRLYAGQQYGTITTVQDENTIYFYNILCGLPTNSWVVGTMSADGTTITIPTEQEMYNSNQHHINLAWGSTGLDGDGNVTFTRDESVTEIVFAVDDGVLTLQGSSGDFDDPNFVLTGISAYWTDDNSWTGAIDIETVLTEKDYEDPTIITEQPEGNLVEYYRTGEGSYANDSYVYMAEQSGKINIVYGNNHKVYLQDPVSHAQTGHWVEGTLSADGTTITVPLGQYLTWSPYQNYGLTIQKITLGVSDEGELTYTVDNATEITFTVDGNSITMNDTYGNMNADWPTEFCGLAAVWSDDLSFSGSMDWNTVYYEAIVAPAVPADPSLDPADLGGEAWFDCGDNSGYSKLFYKINLKDIHGVPIEPQYVSYSIFTDDDQIFTFDAETYSSDFAEDVTEIPYTHSGWDVNYNSAYFYRTNAEGYDRFFNNRIGIQVYYTVDGVKNESNIVYYNLPSFADYGIPANPTVDGWYDDGNEDGNSQFDYTIATTTTDGGLMDPDRIFFSIFTDEDQLFTFDLDTYYDDFGEDYDDDVTMVPYSRNGCDVTRVTTYFYRTNADGYDRFFNHQIGIQVYYLQADGTMTASDIVYLEVFEPQEPEGMRGDVNGDESINPADIAALINYLLNGQEISIDNADCNLDGDVNPADIAALINYLLGGNVWPE